MSDKNAKIKLVVNGPKKPDEKKEKSEEREEEIIEMSFLD
jgi:hypothetical protein